MKVKETFAKRLKALRDEKGLNQTQFAKAVGCVRVTIGHYEKETRSPDIEFLAKIADYFGVTTDYLLGRSDHRSTDNAATENNSGIWNKKIECLRKEKENAREIFINIDRAIDNIIHNIETLSGRCQ